jgi:membrane protease YdiL (CAAX protease family)
MERIVEWLCTIAHLLIVWFGEGLPFRSVGFGRATLLQSLCWRVVLAIICLLLGAIVIALTHYTSGSSGTALAKLPLWLVTLIVVRAGVLEELFYRGYAIDRLQALGLNRYWAVTIRLVIFSLGHWTGGWANIVIALVLGAVLTVFYLCDAISSPT